MLVARSAEGLAMATKWKREAKLSLISDRDNPSHYDLIDRTGSLMCSARPQTDTSPGGSSSSAVFRGRNDTGVARVLGTRRLNYVALPLHLTLQIQPLAPLASF